MNSLIFRILNIPFYLVLFLLLKSSLSAAENKILIYAAASTNDIFIDLKEEFNSSKNLNIRISASSSSTLAKQIISGAPANIYISASWEWIKELNKDNILELNHIAPIFKNKLVLIAPINSKTNYIDNINNESLSKLFDEQLINSRISIADPNHVPAGIYSKEALNKLNVWSKLNRKNMAWGADVRRTLKFVALGNSPLGIVYYTDAIAEPNVKIIGIFDEKLHSPISYWAAIVKNNSTDNAKLFYKFLFSNKAIEIYKSYGFDTQVVKR